MVSISTDPNPQIQEEGFEMVKMDDAVLLENETGMRIRFQPRRLDASLE